MHGKKVEALKSAILPSVEIDPIECPFREFRDNELSIDYWGMCPAALRTVIANKMVIKQAPDYVWVDEQTQPLPRSVRQYLHGWIRAEQLASSRWEEVETVVFQENGSDKIPIIDMQLSHTQVLQRSAFCRRVLSACYILERADISSVEHQWENFSMSLPEGWRPRYHIYSPGTKPGGGNQHRPQLSKNGCYLVRLYYIGAWRCVWVSDQVPVDATGSPLLPFSPLLNPGPKPTSGRQQSPVTMVTSAVVHLWPLLLCKALLKLAAPDMNCDEEFNSIEDEEMLEFKIIHTLTGVMETDVWPTDREDLWLKLVAEAPIFNWEGEDDDTLTNKSKSFKKDKTTKETTVVKRGSIAILKIRDTKDMPPYTLPGISPGHEMDLYVSMLRDVPLKKPLSEPEVALWKYYRWVDWARRHGLYEAYDFPRTRFLKLVGFLKMSYAPHLLDVQSTETITLEFRKAHDRTPPVDKKSARSAILPNYPVVPKEELRDWVLFDNVSETVNRMSVINFPALFNYTTAGSSPPLRFSKMPMNKALDIIAPKSEPMYLQIDSPERNHLKISFNTLHPRVMFNCGVPVLDYVEPAHLILEYMEWFVDSELPKAKAYVCTRGYDTVEVDFLPGRHYCRLWVHSEMNWHVAMLTESSILLGTQDVIQAASVRECPWAINFLSKLGTAFTNLLKFTKSVLNMTTEDDFYKSYQPDLPWNDELVGYKKKCLHWMFRSALQSLLRQRLSYVEFREACIVLRRFLLAPDFGLTEKRPNLTNYRQIIDSDPCDCLIPEPEQIEESELTEESQTCEETRQKLPQLIREQLLKPTALPIFSQVCELATTEYLCGELKEEREKMVRQHEAATLLQAHWRGVMTRKCLQERVAVTPEVLKYLMENAFGHPEALSALMNEFFTMFPGAKHAYSVASALSGTRGIQTFVGQSPISPQSKWIPYFQGVFYCHEPVKVHFALNGTLQFNTLAVYDNDNGLQLPQVYRAAKTFDISPNASGYMVMGHGTLTKPLGYNSEAHWQLTVLSSVRDVFHVCDCTLSDYCREMPLTPSSKLHIDCLFIPNRRNILGSIKLFVMQYGVVSFRAAASSPEVEMVATLKTPSEDGGIEIVDTCAGKGEVYWPYIKLEPSAPPLIRRTITSSRSHAFLSSSQTSKKLRPTSAYIKRNKSTVKLQGKDFKTRASMQARFYTIEVSCPNGWPLTLDQWIRVEEVRNTLEPLKVDTSTKKPPPPSKTPSARDKAVPDPPNRRQPQPGDAYAELECSVAQGGGIIVEQDFSRNLEFEAARRAWDATEPGRNQRGAHIRKEFREEFLEVPAESVQIEEETMGSEYMTEELVESKKVAEDVPVCPSPVSQSEMLAMAEESEEEVKYLNLPEALKDKFVPLPFIPLCLKELSEEERVLITPEMAEAGKSERILHFEGALNHMRELQEYNKLHVLAQHKRRCQLLTKLFVDASWTPELHQVLEERDGAIAGEAQLLNDNAQKKKVENKKK